MIGIEGCMRSVEPFFEADEVGALSGHKNMSRLLELF